MVGVGGGNGGQQPRAIIVRGLCARWGAWDEFEGPTQPTLKGDSGRGHQAQEGEAYGRIIADSKLTASPFCHFFEIWFLLFWSLLLLSLCCRLSLVVLHVLIRPFFPMSRAGIFSLLT